MSSEQNKDKKQIRFFILLAGIIALFHFCNSK